MKNFTKIMFVLLLSALVLVSCGKKEEKKEQIEKVDENVVVETKDESTDEIPFEYTTKKSAKTAVISLYTGNDAHVEIPATIKVKGDTYKVIEIGQGTFFGNENVVSVVVPEGVETIGRAAFQNCEKLESVVLPESLKVIEERAFYNCTVLEQMNIPAKLEDIGLMAFSDYFSKSIWYENICSSAQSVIVGDGILLKCNVPGKAVFGDEVKHVAYYAFENSPTTEVTFTKALETVSPQAVFECKVSFNVEKGAPGLEDAQKTAMPVTEYKPE